MNGSHDPPLSPVGDAALPILYGRETALATLRGTTSGITVVSGDMGIGKSALLARAIDNDHILYVIAPQPATLRYSSGSLRRALLKSLLACVEEIAHDKHAAEMLASHVAEAAKRLAKEKAMQVPRVVGAVILGFIKDRVGSEVTDAIGEFCLAPPSKMTCKGAWNRRRMRTRSLCLSHSLRKSRSSRRDGSYFPLMVVRGSLTRT